MNIDMHTLPHELVNIILDYDGRIKYKYKQKHAIDYHKYVNVIHKYDQRYNVINPVIVKKIQIMKDVDRCPRNKNFMFCFAFDKQPCLCLSYEYQQHTEYIEDNWSIQSVFNISYVTMKESRAVNSSDVIRTSYKW